MTPFRAVYGRDPPTLVKFETGSTANADLESQLKERDLMLGLIQQNMQKAQQMMKQQADAHRREVEFAVGDWLFLKLRPYRQLSLARRVNEKLAARFYGPYEVEAKVGAVSYRLKLPSGSKVHPTFHVSQLKAALGSSLTLVSLPPQLNADGVLEAEPEAFLAEKVNAISGQEEVLIKWKGLPDCDNTWEWKGVIQHQFPTFNLEDKVHFKGEGIDTFEQTHLPVIYQYRRRKNSQPGRTH